ncbi:MAG: TonB-dependent receptor, partial [Candidatus Eisenbacteria sp.]|nr:TonB-dependent receptor [Candidatus Eisenbacteria bacterium]
LSFQQPAFPQDKVAQFKDFKDMSLEELLNQVVVTASRREQRVRESPVAITVITSEDIVESGATNIPDMLRMVAGLDVMAPTASDFNVSARGFNSLLANKMLVLIDGRSVYMDFYGMIMWELLPIALEEIERIEVIKGPGSALYGANAFSGVINIITKSPQDGEGTQVSARAGQYEAYDASLLHTGINGKFNYKISTDWNGTNAWSDKERTSEKLAKFNGLLGYQLGKAAELTLCGGLSDGTVEIFPPGRSGLTDYDGWTRHVTLDYQRAALSVGFFWNGAKLYQDPRTTVPGTLSTNVRTNTYDAELQHSLTLGAKHLLVWGGSFRVNTINWQLLDTDHRQELYAGFLYDEFRPSDQFIISMGGRYDYHPLVKGHLSPQGSLLYSPHRNHTLRVSVGTAFRNPTFLESYWYLEVPQGPGMTMTMYGNEDLESETITSSELGYHVLLSRHVQAKADLFYNTVANFIHSQPAATFPSPPAPSPGIPWEITFVNSGKANAWGGEIGLVLLPADWFKAEANYSYQYLEDQETHHQIESSPEHKLNTRLRFKSRNRLFANLQLHWVSQTTWDWTTETGTLTSGLLPSYTLLNATVAYGIIPDRLEIALAAFNLLDNRHQEHPLTEELRRKLTARIALSF